MGFFFTDATVGEFLKGTVDGTTIFIEMVCEFLYTEFALSSEGVEDSKVMRVEIENALEDVFAGVGLTEFPCPHGGDDIVFYLYNVCA
jgi:hypothetical protein